MLSQLQMIERVRQLCQEDHRVIAALSAGSFSRGEGDEFSDIEFVIFLEDKFLADFDQKTWVAQIAPLEIYFPDDFGHFTAIFSNLVRGEFHFYGISRVNVVESWRGFAWFPSLEATVLLDRTGELNQHLRPLIGPAPAPDIQAEVPRLASNFCNIILFGTNVWKRGEYARSLELLNGIQRYLLFLAHLSENLTYWPTPSKNLERELSKESYARLVNCTAPLDPARLREAYLASWKWGTELLLALAEQHGLDLPHNLIKKLDANFKTL